MLRGAWLVRLAVIAGAATLGQGCSKKTAPSPDPTDPAAVVIRCRPPLVGDRWRVVKTSTAETKSEGDGPAVDVRFESDQERNERVLAVTAGVVTRLEVSFARHGRRNVMRDRPDQLTVAPVVGKTYVLERSAEGDVWITNGDLPASPDERLIIGQDYADFGRRSPSAAAFCDVAFSPGQAVGEPDEEAASQRKRAVAQLGEHARIGDVTMRFVRRDRGAALFAVDTDLETPTSHTRTRHEAWIRPSDGAFTRTETESTTTIDTMSPAARSTKVTTKMFHVEQREGP